MTIDEIMRAAPVIPVLVLKEEMDWAALAETLSRPGLPVLEVTLRTPRCAGSHPADGAGAGAIVGAGTVLNELIWPRPSTRAASSSSRRA